MKNIIQYFIYRKALYILSFLFISIFYLVLYLYGGMIPAIHYASILCLSILAIYAFVDYSLFVRKYKRLVYLQSQEAVYTGDLIDPKNVIEKQYHELLLKVDTLHKQLENKNDKDYHEMVDYFTLWVHQIKTPISALRLLIQSDNTLSNELLMQILKIEQYVDMALHYIKISHMSSDLKIAQYDLSHILNEVIKKQATFFIQKKIKLELDLIDRKILTDEKWISFVIEQVLSNALKYTKEGSIHIYEKDCVLYIEDTGIGIKEEDLPRIFEKGFTGYNGRVDKKASGLGLYLCKRVIDNLGYQINATSTLGKGTIISIDFYKKSLKVE
ncbi:MAG: sensor histidine kinase [Coprobacillus sp.]